MAIKDDRLRIRVARERTRALEEAAESAHLSVSAFVLQAAEERADEILLERQLVRLAPDCLRIEECKAFPNCTSSDGG